MEHPGFFERAGPFRLGDIAAAAGAEVVGSSDPDTLVHDIRPLDLAGADHLTFFDNRKYLSRLRETEAAACLIEPTLADELPAGVAALVTPQPYRAFAAALARFYPEAQHACVWPGEGGGRDCVPAVHASAALEDDVVIEPGAIVGPEARIGRGTRIAAGAVIGYRVTIGRHGYVGANAVITNSLLGDRVIIHAGVCIGQDGFGFAMGADGHLKVPQIGRVIVQDDVEIGANSTVDRGALNDTVIGEGTKIDNLVQIGHNVVIGRHCVLVAMSGIAGSSVLEDFVVMGGKAAVAGHLHVGAGAQIAGDANVCGDLAAGGKYGGFPARPFAQWAREVAVLKQLADKKKG